MGALFFPVETENEVSSHFNFQLSQGLTADNFKHFTLYYAQIINITENRQWILERKLKTLGLIYHCPSIIQPACNHFKSVNEKLFFK
jgi:hypothetical protein